MTSLAFHADQVFYRVPGGIGTYVRRLVPALAAEDPALRVALFHARFRGARPERWMRDLWVEELPWEIRTLYPSWALLRRPRLPSSLAGLDLLHAPSPSAVPPAGRGQRLVVTVHDLAFLEVPETFTPRWRIMFRLGFARTVRHADAVIAVSEATAADVLRRSRIDPGRVHVVAPGPSLDVGRADVDGTLNRLGIPRPYILFVGTLEPRKNVATLVRAYRRLADRGAPHGLVLTGPAGGADGRLEEEIARPGPGSIVRTGRVSDGDLDALYRGATAFCYPSLYEGFGLPVLDAMARGIPCVTSNASSLPEVAGDAALLVDPRSASELASALERVLSDEELAGRLAGAGRGRAATFSWRRAARQTLDVYTGRDSSS